MSGIRRPSYAVLSAFYDEVYGLWRDLLSPARDEILRAHGVRFEDVLDVGCGSGWQSLELARRGARVVAVDPAASFLRPLRTAARGERLAVDVRRGGVLSLPLGPGETFDLALATFDVLNHLDRHEDLAPALAAVAGALRPGGHLLFDLNTPETVEGFPDHHRVTPLSGGGLSAERGEFDAGTGVGTVARDWFLPVSARPGLFRRFREHYREIAWPKPAVERALRKAGLSVRLFADASGWLSFQPEGTRWIVLARRRKASGAGPR
ncbi:MAG: class I SAM-dependent methyltransferase [Thermoanaerobaculia bacterium]|nr:class I SAM-dependent methyltransferase [Thermoanaerobaculia bacterium]